MKLDHVSVVDDLAAAIKSFPVFSMTIEGGGAIFSFLAEFIAASYWLHRTAPSLPHENRQA
jgi:hypothetical protein